MRSHKEPTACSIIEAVLRKADDFLSVRKLVQLSGCTNNQVTAALFNFKKYKVADCVTDGDGLWWFALDPTLDTRIRTVEERTPETKPRKRKVKEQK